MIACVVSKKACSVAIVGGITDDAAAAGAIAARAAGSGSSSSFISSFGASGLARGTKLTPPEPPPRRGGWAGSGGGKAPSGPLALADPCSVLLQTGSSGNWWQHHSQIKSFSAWESFRACLATQCWKRPQGPLSHFLHSPQRAHSGEAGFATGRSAGAVATGRSRAGERRRRRPRLRSRSRDQACYQISSTSNM